MDKKIGVALLLLLFASPLLAQTFAAFKSDYGQYFENRLNSWMPLAMLAILISIAFNVLVYMAGFALESEGLKRYAKSEFLQVSASSLMIFFAVSLLYLVSSGPGTGSSAFDFMQFVIGGGSSVSCAAVQDGRFNIWADDGGFGRGPIGAFKCKLQEKIDALDRSYNNVVETNKPMEASAAQCIFLLGVQVWCGDWELNLHKQVESSHLVATKITSLLVPLHAQFVLAEYIQKNMLTVFLPLGLVLRVFPITRGVGGLFIAMGVGFFFIFPTFFLLTDPTFVKVDEGVRSTIEGACFTGFRGASVVLTGIFNSAGSASASALATGSAAELVYQITIATMFYPFIALVVTLMFIRAMTPLLGGDLGELMRMVGRLG